MTSADLMKFEPQRRYATLVADSSRSGPQLRAATLPGKRPYARHGRNRILEHRLCRASSPRFIAARPTPVNPTTQVPLPARMGAHQPHRRLPVEEQEASNGQV